MITKVQGIYCQPHQEAASLRIPLSVGTTFIYAVTKLIRDDNATLPSAPITQPWRQEFLRIQDDDQDHVITSLSLVSTLLADTFSSVLMFRASFLNFAPLSFHAHDATFRISRFLYSRCSLDNLCDSWLA